MICLTVERPNESRWKGSTFFCSSNRWSAWKRIFGYCTKCVGTELSSSRKKEEISCSWYLLHYSIHSFAYLLSPIAKSTVRHCIEFSLVSRMKNSISPPHLSLQNNFWENTHKNSTKEITQCSPPPPPKQLSRGGCLLLLPESRQVDHPRWARAPGGRSAACLSPTASPDRAVTASLKYTSPDISLWLIFEVRTTWLFFNINGLKIAWNAVPFQI